MLGIQHPLLPFNYKQKQRRAASQGPASRQKQFGAVAAFSASSSSSAGGKQELPLLQSFSSLLYRKQKSSVFNSRGMEGQRICPGKAG